MTCWLGSKRRLAFLEEYRAAPKAHIIYCLVIPEDNILKIGRTSRLSFRIRNLRASIYKDHEFHLIHCADADESLGLDRFLKKALKPKHVIGEFFRTDLEHVEQVLNESPAFSHLAFQKENTPQWFTDGRTKSINNITFNISIS